MEMKAVERPRRFSGEQGQAVTEYALLVFWTVVIVWAAYMALQAALLDSYQDLASLICLPIP
jgi:Flp pilus assembly pilin Flp